MQRHHGNIWPFSCSTIGVENCFAHCMRSGLMSDFERDTLGLLGKRRIPWAPPACIYSTLLERRRRVRTLLLLRMQIPVTIRSGVKKGSNEESSAFRIAKIARLICPGFHENSLRIISSFVVSLLQSHVLL